MPESITVVSSFLSTTVNRYAKLKFNIEGLGLSAVLGNLLAISMPSGLEKSAVPAH